MADAARQYGSESQGPTTHPIGAIEMLTVARQRIDTGPSRLRLQTIVRLRWFAIVGQSLTIATVYWGLGFDLPIGLSLAVIALSAWLNIFLRIRYPARTRLGAPLSTILLAYDIAQLAALLYLTGGLENPFAFLIVAPVTVSAATQPPKHTVALGIVAVVTAAFLAFYHLPLPWAPDDTFTTPLLYRLGLLAAITCGLAFLGLYAWRLSTEAKEMSDALAAAELALAREQRLQALDGLAAAAAHELGTPLATITVVAKELERELPPDSPLAEDAQLLRSEARRCREILGRLTAHPGTAGEEDPMHSRMTLTQIIEEAASPYRSYDVEIAIMARRGESAETLGEPVGERNPAVLYGLGNIIENATDFARSRVEIEAEWTLREVRITIADDGPGFPPHILDSLGEPYVTTRPMGGRSGKKDGEMAGLGLGFFIAKTLLERSGASLELENKEYPASGAVVRITWPRNTFVAMGQRAEQPEPPPHVAKSATSQ